MSRALWIWMVGGLVIFHGLRFHFGASPEDAVGGFVCGVVMLGLAEMLIRAGDERWGRKR